MSRKILGKKTKNVTRKQNRKERKIKEKEIDKKCHEMKSLLEEYYNTHRNLSSIKGLEIIEDTLKSSIDWYINNKRRKKAIENIFLLTKLLDFEKAKYYNPNFTKELAMSKMKTAIVNFREPYLLKQHMLNRLFIRVLLLEGFKKGAREIYQEELEDLGIKLNTRELKKSLKYGMKKGCYYIEKDGNFEEVTIIGNEKILKYIDKINDKEKDKDEDKITDKKNDKVKEENNKNVEDIELKYLLELKSRNQLEYKGLKERLLQTENYSKLIQDLIREAKSDGVKLLAMAEDLKNGVYRQFIGKPTNIERFTNLFKRVYEQIGSNQITNPKLIKLIADIKNNGIRNQFDNVVLEPDKNVAINLYKKINCCEDTNKDQSKETPQEKSIYVCSDLHGQYDVYKTMIGQLKEGDKLYILGDVIDRGPGGIKILQDIIQHKDKIEFFIGNHELMMIQSLFLKEEKERKNWIRDSNGGKETEEQFNKLSQEEQEEIQKLLMSALVYKEIKVNGENIYLVHAKASPAKGKNQETVYEFLQQGRENELKECVWSRVNTQKNNNTKDVWKESDIGKENTFTIIGHTPTDNNKIRVYDSFVDIDCGAAYYGNGCLLRLNDGKVVYFDNVTRCLEQEREER